MRLIDLVKLRPGVGWSWWDPYCGGNLYENPNITMADILESGEPHLMWNDICINPSITFDEIYNHPERPLDIDPHNNYRTYWRAWSYNPNIKLSDFDTSPRDIPWYRLAYNPEFSLETLEQHDPDLIYGSILTNSPHLTLKYVIDHPNKHWDWTDICEKCEIHIHDVLNHPELPWKWHALTENSGIYIEDIMANAHLPWDQIVYNPHITIDFALDHPELCSTSEFYKELFWQRLGNTLPIQTIMDHPNLPWSWKNMCFNPSLTLQVILDNPDHMITTKLDWCMFSRYGDITVQDVADHPELPWNYGHLSANTFGWICEDKLSRFRIMTRTHVYKQELFAYVYCNQTT
jgi:hypothetical protein